MTEHFDDLHVEPGADRKAGRVAIQRNQQVHIFRRRSSASRSSLSTKPQQCPCLAWSARRAALVHLSLLHQPEVRAAERRSPYTMELAIAILGPRHIARSRSCSLGEVRAAYRRTCARQLFIGGVAHVVARPFARGDFAADAADNFNGSAHSICSRRGARRQAAMRDTATVPPARLANSRARAPPRRETSPTGGSRQRAAPSPRYGASAAQLAVARGAVGIGTSAVSRVARRCRRARP